jgi:hypothetical protein
MDDKYNVDLVDCLECNKRFIAYPDGVDVCTACMLNKPELKQTYKGRPKPVSFQQLFE